jgi:hypothetical protein
MLTLLTLVALLGAQTQSAPTSAEVTLVVERGPSGEHTYTANGKVLDPKRVMTGLHTMLRVNDPGNTRMFVLFSDTVSLDTTFEVGSLIDGVMGLKNVRYFAFSRKTGVMEEIKLFWEPWKLSFDGKLEKKPF